MFKEFTKGFLAPIGLPFVYFFKALKLINPVERKRDPAFTAGKLVGGLLAGTGVCAGCLHALGEVLLPALAKFGAGALIGAGAFGLDGGITMSVVTALAISSAVVGGAVGLFRAGKKLVRSNFFRKLFGIKQPPVNSVKDAKDVIIAFKPAAMEQKASPAAAGPDATHAAKDKTRVPLICSFSKAKAATSKALNIKTPKLPPLFTGPNGPVPAGVAA